jgi:signal transduction histidine kinase
MPILNREPDFGIAMSASAESGNRRGPKAVYAKRRIVVALVMIGLLMCGALAVAARSHDKSVRAGADARSQRDDTLAAEQAVSAFWHEREAMGDVLAFPHGGHLSEVNNIRLRFRAALVRIQRPSPAEVNQIQLALDANEQLITVFKFLPPLSGAATDGLAELSMRGAEASVLGPIAQLSASSNSDDLNAEARATTAERAAFRSEVVTSLLGLAAVIWFAIFATRLVRRIGKQNVELQLADVAKDAFISTVSHELRTPLTSMHGFLELLLDDSDDPLSQEQRSYVTTVQRGSVRLGRLVNDLLLTAQLREGPLDIRTAEADLVEIACVSVTDAQAQAAQSALELTIAVPFEVILIECDVVRLGQAIGNLISNAIKFTAEGGRVEVTVVPDGNHVTLTVSDTGMGITSSDLERLFEPFFRTESAQAKQIQGTGLGLPIVKAIVEAHNGTINITSEPNVGTAFTISLPLAQPLRPHIAASHEEGHIAV